MAKSCSRSLESKGAATTKPLSRGAGSFPTDPRARGEFKPWDSGVTAIMAHHAPPPIDISIASGVAPSTVLVASVYRPISAHHSLRPRSPSLRPSPPSAFNPHPRRRLHPSSHATIPAFYPSLFLGPPRSHLHLFIVHSLSPAVESCNRDLVHPYRNNDRSPGLR